MRIRQCFPYPFTSDTSRRIAYNGEKIYCSSAFGQWFDAAICDRANPPIVLYVCSIDNLSYLQLQPLPFLSLKTHIHDIVGITIVFRGWIICIIDPSSGLKKSKIHHLSMATEN